MWKFIPRGIRETLERGFNIHRRSDSRVTFDKKTFNCSILEGFRSISSGNPGCEQSKKQGAYYNDRSWFSAFSCSGALALGWVLSQPCIWKKLNGKHSPLRKLNLTELTVVALLQANDVKEVVNCSDSIDGSIVYGPKTAEESLNEGIEDFINVHNKLWAEIENGRGMACIVDKKNVQAFKHFVRSSKFGYPPAEYNIALCYEHGIGTKQDLTKAVDWYQKASLNGHPTAMYNLGVFYARGWGGLNASTERAKDLFIQAAGKGQPNAIAALGQQGKVNKSNQLPPTLEPEEKSEHHVFDKCKKVDTSNNDDYLLKSSLEPKDEYKSLQSKLLLHLYNVSSDLKQSDTKTRLQTSQTIDFKLLGEHLFHKNM